VHRQKNAELVESGWQRFDWRTITAVRVPGLAHRFVQNTITPQAAPVRLNSVGTRAGL
jgi:hypothetical protein